MIVYGVDHIPYEYPASYRAANRDTLDKTRRRAEAERAATLWLSDVLHYYESDLDRLWT